MLADRALLALAAKKAYKFLDRRQWYHDRSDSATFMSRMTYHVQKLSDEILTGEYSPSQRFLFQAPKRIEETELGPRCIYRPLTTQAFRDEVTEVSLLCLFADHFEERWGDPASDAYPNVFSFGNRLHCVGVKEDRKFSLGSGRLYRDWSDDYSTFVRETERAFNKTLEKLSGKRDERVVLICSDLKSFYPSIDRSRISEIIQKLSSKNLKPIIAEIFGSYKVQSADEVNGQASLLRDNGLAQGPAHSGFWANVYLQDFDRWIYRDLTKELRSLDISCSIEFYARYVDDFRVIFRVPKTMTAELAGTFKALAAKYLNAIGLSLSLEKTTQIIQDANGSLLSTGQIAERMQSITRRAYFPLPPEDLDDLAKEVRLLFHAETLINAKTIGGQDVNELPKSNVILDNPGVRPDSRRRFAANKWARIARDLEKVAERGPPDRKAFAEELTRAWHVDLGKRSFCNALLILEFTHHPLRQLLGG